MKWRVSLLLALPVIIAGIVLISFELRRPQSPIEAPEPPSQDAQLLADFYKQHHGAIGQELRNTMRKDPTFAKALLSVKPATVHSLAGLSEDEKRSLLRLVELAQKEAQAHQRLGNKQ